MKRKSILVISLSIILVLVVLSISYLPNRAFGEVQPITDVENKLEGVTEEEKKVLEKLFTINQEMDDLKAQQDVINGEIDDLKSQICTLEEKIEAKQKDYDLQLEVLKEVLVDYQRGGPATYLEILLRADNLSTFLKSINIIKDISHNVDGLLNTLEEGKKALQEEKTNLDNKAAQLALKKDELTENLHNNELLQQEQKTYLASLQEDKAFYQEQLGNLQSMWTDCKALFPKVAEGITDTINAGYFSVEDLNISFGLFSAGGFLKEDTFNKILKENSKLPEITFHFQDNQVVLEVPGEHLTLTGNFVTAKESAIQFEVKSGTFYDLPLEASAIEELFQNGPLLIDFKTIAKDIITVNFTLNSVQSQEGSLAFNVMLKW